MKQGILLSGGLDSTALAYWHRNSLSIAFTINYGQKSAQKEIAVSAKICKELGLQHEVLEADCGSLGGGEMSDNPISSLSNFSEWWPFRNQLLITLAAMRAVTLGIETIMFGAVKTDNRFADGRATFFKSVNYLLNQQEGSIQILTPAIELYSIELIRKSKVPEHLLFWAHSCHRGNEPCGFCNGCNKYSEVVNMLY